MKKKLSIIIVLLISSGIGLLFAANQGYFGYSISSGGLIARLNQTLGSAGSIYTYVSKVEEHSICKTITSTDSRSLFIPTKTSAERTGFIANKPSYITLGTCGCKTNSDCSVGSVCSGYVAPTTSYCGGMYYFPNYYSGSCYLASNSYDMSYGAWQTTVLDAKAVDTLTCYTRILQYGGAWYGRNTSYYGTTNNPCYNKTTPSTCTAVTYKQTRYTNTSTTNCPGSTYTTQTASCSWDTPVNQCINITNATVCNSVPSDPHGGCSRVTGKTEQLGTCIVQTCGTANGQTYSTLTSTSPNLCNIGSATSFTSLTSSWSWNCGTASCYAMKTPPAGTTCVAGTPAACFIAGTQVKLADGTTTNIEDITKDIKVLGSNGETQTVQKPLKIRYTGKLYAINGSDYFVTASHPFMTIEGWKSFDPDITKTEIPDLIVTKLEIGDILVTERGLEQLYQANFKETNKYVYNLALDGNHTYYADGYLVHNKLALGVGCTYNVQCDSNYCVAGSCVNAGYTSVNSCCSCTVKSQCPIGYDCISGKCTTAGVTCSTSQPVCGSREDPPACIVGTSSNYKYNNPRPAPCADGTQLDGQTRNCTLGTITIPCSEVIGSCYIR